ncbi:MAG: hypothetical protein IKW08_07710 [Roseburia sp.]|nr:hypothetical protein [Roseburia sp.]
MTRILAKECPAGYIITYLTGLAKIERGEIVTIQNEGNFGYGCTVTNFVLHFVQFLVKIGLPR